jgi:hypothetical protein
MTEDSDKAYADRLRTVVQGLQSVTFIAASAVVGGVAAHFLLSLTTSTTDQVWSELLKTQFQAVVGLPAAGAVAFLIVVVLRQVDGPIKFKGLSFEFEGAAGQVVMWVITFLAIASAIHMCWDTNAKVQ